MQVILIHGLARTTASMASMARTLERHGYCVYTIAYASTRLSIEVAAKQLFQQVLARIDSSQSVHIVTHSMGAILTRYYLAHYRIVNLQSIVMIAPPNHGCEIVDRIGHWWLFRYLHGPAGQQLGCGENSLPKQLPTISYPTGIIAGRRRIPGLFSAFLSKPNDGKVSVASTRLKGMQDHLLVNAGHTFIMNRPAVHKAVVRFLQSGRFT